MSDAAQLSAIVEPVVSRLGYALVRVSLQGGRRSCTLQVMAERPETGQLDLEDCARISRELSPILDAADPIPDEYRLEVSSPGIDRPLTRPQDWDTYAGHEARVTLDAPVEGRKRFQGRVLGREGDAARLDVPGLGETVLPLSHIASAKLLLTDALIKATAPLSTEGADKILEDRR